MTVILAGSLLSATGQEVMVDRAQEIGLFRWRIVGEATDVSLSARERGALVRGVGGAGAPGPGWAVGAGVAQHAGSLDPGVS